MRMETAAFSLVENLRQRQFESRSPHSRLSHCRYEIIYSLPYSHP